MVDVKKLGSKTKTKQRKMNRPEKRQHIMTESVQGILQLWLQVSKSHFEVAC